jgi:DNA/RNA endonuclease G (NUC1)
MTQNAVLDPDLSTLQSCTPKVYKNVEVPLGHLAPTAICTGLVPKMIFWYFTFLYTLVYNLP